VPGVSLLLALRQDAFAAKSSDPTADNCLRLAGLLGIEALDWPLALEIATVGGRAQRQLELQRDSRYLATLYPDPASLRLAEPLASAAWPIEGIARLVAKPDVFDPAPGKSFLSQGRISDRRARVVSDHARAFRSA